MTTPNPMQTKKEKKKKFEKEIDKLMEWAFDLIKKLEK